MFMFPHEDLHVYALALDLALWIRALSFPRGDSPLRDQARRASSSVVLNIAEGRSQTGRSRAHHFTIAMASAAEVAAILDLLEHPDAINRKKQVRRVGAMLRALNP